MKEQGFNFADAVAKINAAQDSLMLANIVAHLPSEPGWRACLVEKHGDVVELRLVRIFAWGFRSSLPMFDDVLFHQPGRGPGTLVPSGEGGTILDGPAFAGLAGPGDADDVIQARFEEMRRDATREQ